MNDKEEPIYCMTIELEKGKPEQINIYRESNGNELAFGFCKEHDLDFAAFDFLKNQIDELLLQFREKNSNGAEGDDLIEELEDENIITEENKRENVKTINEESDRDDENDNNHRINEGNDVDSNQHSEEEQSSGNNNRYLKRQKGKNIYKRQCEENSDEEEEIVMEDEDKENGEGCWDDQAKEEEPEEIKEKKVLDTRDHNEDENEDEDEEVEEEEMRKDYSDDDNDDRKKVEIRLKRTSPGYKSKGKTLYKQSQEKAEIIQDQNLISIQHSDDILNTLNSNENNTINPNKSNISNNHYSITDSNQLNSFIEAPLSISNANLISESFDSKPLYTQNNNNTSSICQSTPRLTDQDQQIEHNHITTPKKHSHQIPSSRPSQNNRTNPQIVDNEQYTFKQNKPISPEKVDQSPHENHPMIIPRNNCSIQSKEESSTNYYSELGFMERMEYFKELYKQRKIARKSYTENSQDETGQRFFRPRLIGKKNETTIQSIKENNNAIINNSNGNCNGNKKNVFINNYEYAMKYQLDKEQLIQQRINETTYEPRSFSKKKNEKLISNLHTEIFIELFNELDSDQDDLITYISINTKNSSKEVIKIIQPLITELKDDKQMLKRHEFILAMNQLYERLTRKEREVLIKEMKKKITARRSQRNQLLLHYTKKSNNIEPYNTIVQQMHTQRQRQRQDNEKLKKRQMQRLLCDHSMNKSNEPVKNDAKTQILARNHQKKMEQVYSKYIPLIKKRVNLNRTNFFKKQPMKITDHGSFNGNDY